MNEEQLRAFKALADPTRHRIIAMLLNSSLCVRGVARRLGLSEPAISQHLQVLKQAGLVTSEKKGYYVHSSADTEALLGLAEALQKWVLVGTATLNDCRREQAGRCIGQCQHAAEQQQECEKSCRTE